MDVIDELKYLGKFTKKIGGGGWGGRGQVRGLGWWGGGEGRGGCERRIEVFVKIQKKNTFFFWGGGWGGQCGCERRIEIFGKIHKNKFRGGGGSGLWGGGVRVDVNAMSGVGGDVGYGDVNQE